MALHGLEERGNLSRKVGRDGSGCTGERKKFSKLAKLEPGMARQKS